MTNPQTLPLSGGSYIKGEDGTRTLVVAPTGERPCKCRPEPPVPEPPALPVVLDAEAEEHQLSFSAAEE